jgi:hypothetical protein
MRNRIIFTCLLFLVSLPFVFAQSGNDSPNHRAFSVGLDLGIPANSIYNIGIGASAKLEVPVISALSLSVTGGYSSLHFKRSILGQGNSPKPDGFVPLKAGVKYYFSPGFYGEAEAGAALRANHGSGAYFAYAPGIGFSVPFNHYGGLDIGIRFEKWANSRGFTSLRQSAIRVAYKIGW